MSSEAPGMSERQAVAGAGADREAGGASAWRRLGYILPVLVFLVVAGGLAIGLTRDPSSLPSALIDKPVPDFDLPPLKLDGRDVPGLASRDLVGKVQLVNVFASWCGPCRVEHPVLMKLAADGVPIQGIDYKDAPGDAAGFLGELGNPYQRIGADANGRVGIDWGVYGVPETYVIGADGKIRYRHVGPIQGGDVETLTGIIQELRGGS